MTQMPPLRRASEDVFDGNGNVMGPRINLRRDTGMPQNPSAHTIWSVFRRSDEKCHSGSDYDTCEKGINTNITNLAIILGVVIPLIVASFVLLFLHRRNIKKLKLEDAQDPHKGLDFGMGDPGKGKRKSLFGLGGEKSHHRNNQLSMDMNLSSPYLLPPAAQGSQESVNTLARTLPSDQDPYRTVKQYANSDAGSIRSYGPGRDPSLYRGKTPGSVMSSKSRNGSQRMAPSRSASRANESPSDANSNPFATPTSPKATHQFPLPGDVDGPVRRREPVIPEICAATSPDERAKGLDLDVSTIQPPPRVLSQESHYGMPGPTDAGRPVASAHGAASSAPRLEINVPQIYSPDEYGAADGDAGHASSYDDHGRPPAQQSEHQEQQKFQGGLGVPQPQMKRLSVGFRPLPPDEVMESEDPEYRANRIRSFYKEYFDDKEPPPPMPSQAPVYHEDYDSSYPGDAAYYDAENHAFVMQYAQPVTRRAMTPPPAGRFRGGPGGPAGPGPYGPPRGGPRGPGSVGGMSLPGGPGGRPRAGSAHGPRPGSSASMGPRGRPMKKNLPPPAPLPTLPTPSKLKDDSFAILNAADFAPPDSFREQASGRSQSPLGERRQFLPKVPVASPLVTSFDELSALPSPHVLRKSSTFTNLDFAPPKKFKDAETSSDAGSIRSNKSGISQAQHDAIRRGAGRVSRLPGDTVFTPAATGDTLKPSWDMRT
ncbi:hypothetical protein E4U42_000998 [Claviceps africana]|uniref:Uncharacterized protein n=1 Tax=Claviceps africana TaxID=83212 RepID=A0A8K0NE44_9HYPO|nr:hypothetical protein E4U42_000998 [Claviceps africana]